MVVGQHAPSGHLSDKLVGQRMSELGGMGVVARSAVRAGEILAVWGGEVVRADALAEMSAGDRRLTLQIEEDLYLVTRVEGPADWINHSCEPNAGLCGQVVLVAMRDIGVGEQICYDYAMSDGSAYDEFPCACAGPSCRRRVTGADWQDAALWPRYDGYFSPYLARRIAALRERPLAVTLR